MRIKAFAFVLLWLSGLASAQVDNCCFVDRQCHSENDWTDGYWAFQQSQCSAHSQPASAVSAQVDNCCFAGWQCATDQEWTNGYHAYQNGQCSAPAQSGSATQNIPTGQIDNCCQAGWQCITDQEWIAGYHAYQNRQCAAPAQSGSASRQIPIRQTDNCCFAGWHCESEQDYQRGWAAYKYFQCSEDVHMRISGSATFVSLMRAAYNRLKQASPRLYHYGITGFNSITEGPTDGGTGYYDDDNRMEHAFGRGSYDEYDVVYAAGSILHEACHGHQKREGTGNAIGWKNELPCMRAELEAYQTLDPQDQYGLISWAQDVIDNIQNPSYWWW